MSYPLELSILEGKVPPSAAIGRADIYSRLNTGKSGNRLSFLGTSAKVIKAEKDNILTHVLYMMAANSSGREACAHRTAGCSSACLVSRVGKMDYPNAIRARARRHASFYADRNRFLCELHAEIDDHIRRARKAGMLPAIRLNGTTDIPWHRLRYTRDGETFPNLHSAFPECQFYDYTKYPLALARKNLPENLHLTYSVSEWEKSERAALEYLRAGFSAAVVVRMKRHDMPKSFELAGRRIRKLVDGDVSDARFTDPPGSLVLLSAKGRARSDNSGFTKERN